MVKKSAFALLFSMACFTGSAFAVSIPIANFSFENPVVAAFNGGPSDVITGWNATGVAQVANGPVAAADGLQYLQIANGQLTPGAGHLDQTLAVDLVANTVYTLSYFTGARGDFNPSDYTVSLEANNVVLASLSDPYTGPLGQMVQKTFSFSSGSSVAPGQALQIVIDVTGANNALSLKNGFPVLGIGAFDAITLDATTQASVTPEPSSIALSVCGIALFGWLRKRRAK
jgi:hypothetical protein